EKIAAPDPGDIPSRIGKVGQPLAQIAERLGRDEDRTFIEVFIVTLLWRKPVRGVSILGKVVLFLIVDVIQSNPDMLRAYTLRDVVDLLNNPFNRCAAHQSEFRARGITMEIAHAINAN